MSSHAVIEEGKVPGGDVPRALHWVFKIGDLKKSLDFYEVLGLGITRHEEFDTGCEATCNGPYEGSWSKTMIGPKIAHESEHFALELTYNYGIYNYRKGNDYRYIAMKTRDIPQKAKAKGYDLIKDAEYPGTFLRNPDGMLFKLVDVPKEEDKFPDEPFLYVSLNVEDLSKSIEFWHKVIGMNLYEKTDTSALVGFGDDQAKIELVQLPANEKVDRGEAFGRIAFSTKDIMPKYEAAKASGDKIQNDPIYLPTPGKPTCHVTILQARNGQEICFVEEKGFYGLSTCTPEMEFIDWEDREKKDQLIQKYQARKDKQ